jgi:DNA helicase HerA-like ATPase
MTATVASDSTPSTGEVATSPDGRTFLLNMSPHQHLAAGSCVSLTDDQGVIRLAQVETRQLLPDGRTQAAGRVLGTLNARGLDDGAMTAFASATVGEADADMIRSLNSSAGATLDIGSMASGSDLPARLIPRRLNRHTFWCGQSGSGKTYALGVLLEEVLLQTELPLIIFDPNGDFVRLAEVRADAPREVADRLRQLQIRVLRPRSQGGEPLLVRFTDLELPSKAAVMRLDPLVDRVEYNTTLHLEEQLAARPLGELLPTLRESDEPGADAFALRIENLGLLNWEIWALGQQAATDIIDTRPAATVLDLGGFRYNEEPLVVALSVLDELWSRRNERRPALLVIDEAHNLCTPDAASPLLAAVRERINQIAAEGRKFGLWLLISTQRPSKVHPGIISQCDNLALMKMSSQTDLDELGKIFGFAPTSLLSLATGFRQGEALFAGGFAPAAMTVRGRKRLTEEGGHDVGVPLRQ